MHNPSRRALHYAIALALGAASVVGPAQPAQAMNTSYASLTGWTFTDSTHPSTPSVKPAGDAPVGSTVDADGTRHTHRVYFTFDISAYRGQVIHQSTLWTTETEVADCGTVAPIEVWRTGPVTDKSTWNKPPKQLELVARRTFGKGAYCPGAYLGADLAGYVTSALARHEKTITFEVRLAAPAESDPTAWRSLQPLHLSMSTNHLPTVSGLKLADPDRPCGTLGNHPTAGGNTSFAATAADADPNSYVTTTFALWPADRPDQRTVFGNSGGAAPRATTSLSQYPDGTLLAWSAQPRDYDDQGAWGKTCYLTIDNTAPAKAPVIVPRKYVETGYPGSGGPGVAGTFLVDAQGDRDVVAFDYYEQQGYIVTTVKANHPGGHARVSVTPRQWGDDELRVRSVDAAGNRGPWQSYHFYVRDTAPSIDLDVAGVGMPSTITLYSQAAEVTSFGYTVDGGPETKVPAAGGKGTGQVVFATRGYKTVVSRSYAGKKMIGSYSRQFEVSDAPKLASAQFLFPAEPILGDQGAFTFTPRTTGVVAYLYDFGDGDQKRVAANPDGTATLPWTADKPGYYYLSVVSVTADGTQSLASSDQFWVVDTHPSVSSDAGICCPVIDAVGRPVRVSLGSDLPGVTGFVYSYDGGADQRVDGANTGVMVTPTHVGDSSFTARAVLPGGTLSPPTTITITITNAPLVANRGPYDEQAVVGRDSTFTFKPATPNVVSYKYYWGYFPDSPQTVDAAADGSATVVWAPSGPTTNLINVVAVSRDGTESDVRQLYVQIVDPGVTYTGSWDSGSASGGLGVPGRLGFYGTGASLPNATVKYLWHVDDEPVQEIAPAGDALVTEVPYTPTRNGANTLYVQRQFTDGVLSPISQYTLLVGTHPLVASGEYPTGDWLGGPGVTGTFRFSGGMPGIVSYDYRFVDQSGTEAAAGTATADAAGAGQVSFTPAAAFTSYTLTVTGHTADGTATDPTTYSFGAGNK